MNTSKGLLIGVFTFLFGFAMVWSIWRLAILGALGMIFMVIARACDDDTEYVISAAEVEKIENERYRQFASVTTNRPTEA
ncbi:MAG TPA: hypothetical protein HPP90_14730 [Deltaproteobacteria bacterium]|nr:hypothetical protein [Deltaproteobacteria bacterium]